MKIGILGDSISMTIGLGSNTYPYLLAEHKGWPSNTEIINFSQPGNTACDCLANLRQFLRRSTLDFVIICLGTCDSISTEHIKGTGINWWRKITTKPVRKRFSNSPRYREWNADYDQAFEKTESIADFTANVEKILSLCKKRQIGIVLVIPTSNTDFPPGLAKGNFIFYDIWKTPLTSEMELPCQCPNFSRALRLHIKRDYSGAKDAYVNFINSHSERKQLGTDSVSVALNNYAMCCFYLEEYEEAALVLRLLTKERFGRRDIATHNLSGVQTGLCGESERDLDQSDVLEADTGNYRIRPSFSQRLREIGENYSDQIERFHQVDCSKFLTTNYFFDHCHPDADGHRKIASEIVRVFSTYDMVDQASAQIRNELSNPEIGFGLVENFVSYYKLEAPYSAMQIRATMQDFHQQLLNVNGDQLHGRLEEIQNKSESDLVKYSARVAAGFLKHPMYANLDLILAEEAFEAVDFGRFPDFFFFRQLYPYIKFFEKNEELKRYLKPLDGLIPSSGDVAKMFSMLQFDLTEKPIAESPPKIWESPDLQNAVLRKVAAVIDELIAKGDISRLREKTTMYWFFSETIRFGSQSRESMRFDQVALEHAAEALLRIVVTNALTGKQISETAENLIFLLGDLKDAYLKLVRNSSQRFTSAKVGREFSNSLDRQKSRLTDLLSLGIG